MANRTVYHVVPKRTGGWDVKKTGAARASAHEETKDAAIRVGRELAKANRPSQLVIHKLDGTIETEWKRPMIC